VGHAPSYPHARRRLARSGRLSGADVSLPAPLTRLGPGTSRMSAPASAIALWPLPSESMCMSSMLPGAPTSGAPGWPGSTQGLRARRCQPSDRRPPRPRRRDSGRGKGTADKAVAADAQRRNVNGHRRTAPPPLGASARRTTRKRSRVRWRSRRAVARRIRRCSVAGPPPWRKRSVPMSRALLLPARTVPSATRSQVSSQPATTRKSRP